MSSSVETASAGDVDVTDVLVMFKSHLDVGFTNTEDAVLRMYFDEHIPNAVARSSDRRVRGTDRFVWTIPAWLLYRYLEQADPGCRAVSEECILAGDMAWHALPFTWFTEMLDQSAIAASIGFSRALDERYGVVTTAARLTDVPGHSRGLIRPLADAGVTFLDVGCNPGCRPPRVPFVLTDLTDPSIFDVPDPDHLTWLDEEPVHKDFATSSDEVSRFATEGLNSARTHLFRWVAPDDAAIAVLYHPNGYGSTVRIPGTTTAVSMRVHGDNLSPHSEASIDSAFSSLRKKFPNARVRAASLSDIGAFVTAAPDPLPVVDQEIGDTWIYGTGSDPAKSSSLREVLRLRAQWIADGRLASGDAQDLRLLGDLIMSPEHNWGLNTSVYLRRWDTYRIDELAAARAADPSLAFLEAEWAHQRERAWTAVRTLDDPLRQEGQERLAALSQRPVPIPGRVLDDCVTADNGRLILRVDAVTGAIASLVDRSSGREWAGVSGLAQFSYQVFSAQDYLRFNQAYNTAAFTYNDFGKPHLAEYGVGSQLYVAPSATVSAYTADEGTGAHVTLTAPQYAPDDEGTAGWPADIQLRFHLRPGRPQVDITCWVAGKPANRRPEALWLSFVPDAPDNQGWLLDKVDLPVAPHDVVPGGGRHLHGVGRGASYADDRGWLALETLDAHLVSPGERALLRYDDEPLDTTGGMHVNLYNNLWGTAFPQWYDTDMRFRFVLHVGSDGRPPFPAPQTGSRR